MSCIYSNFEQSKKGNTHILKQNRGKPDSNMRQAPVKKGGSEQHWANTTQLQFCDPRYLDLTEWLNRLKQKNGFGTWPWHFAPR